MYVNKGDFEAHQRLNDLDVLTRGSDSILSKAINATEEEVASYLRMRFDVSKVLYDVLPWNSSTQYVEGDQVYKYDSQSNTYTHYVALKDNTNQDPANGQPDWDAKDGRSALLVMRLIDMTVYHLHAKIPQKQTPQDVNDRYVDAVDWFKGVSKGNYNPNFPKIEDTSVKTNLSQWGSSETNTSEW